MAASDERLDVRGDPVRVTTLLPWADSELQRWLNDLPAGPSERPFRDAVMAATGGWGGLLHRLHDGEEPRPTTWQPRLEALAAEVLADPAIPRELGIRPEMWEVFAILAAYQGPGEERLTLEDLAILVDGYDARLTERVVRYSESLGLLQTSATGWSLDPLVARLLAARETPAGRP
jgi:hypothetical protein